MNNFLLAAVVGVNVYTVSAPLLPKLDYWRQSRGQKAGQLQQKAVAAVPASKAPATDSARQPNELIVPSMLLDQPVLEGATRDMYKVLHNGIWHWPLGSSPDKGGNTVLLGHRFTYTNPRGVLYNLDKVRVGDTIGLTWNDTKYIYKVSRTSVVPPSDTSVAAPTKEPTLTIYTCTPLWKPRDRLVVTAELEQKL